MTAKSGRNSLASYAKPYNPTRSSIFGMGFKDGLGKRFGLRGLFLSVIVLCLTVGPLASASVVTPAGPGVPDSPFEPTLSSSYSIELPGDISVSNVSNFTPGVVLSPLFYGVNVRSDAPFTVADAEALANSSALT